MKIPLHIRLRKKINSTLQNILSFFIKNNSVEKTINKNEIKTILLIRPNYRIGNLIFLTPLINELYKSMPEVKIDIIVGMKLAGNILKPLPNVQNVLDLPRNLLLNPFKLFNFIQDVKKVNYDLAINIEGASTSSQLVTTLVNATYKASFFSQKNWSPLTHIVKKEGLFTHSALQPLELLKLFDAKLPNIDPFLNIKLTQDELHSAQNRLNFLLTANKLNTQNYKTIALFRNARFDKKIPDEWWDTWHKEILELDKNIIIIDIMSPDILNKLNENVLEYSDKNLRQLGAFFKSCDMYVSADTGPMHLASASGAKTLAYFNKTSIEIFGTLGKIDKTVNINNLSIKEVAALTIEHLKKVK